MTRRPAPFSRDVIASREQGASPNVFVHAGAKSWERARRRPRGHALCLPPGDPQAVEVTDRLAASVYRQAEAKQASSVVVSDAVPLLFPVRSLRGVFAWATIKWAGKPYFYLLFPNVTITAAIARRYW